MSHTPDYQHAHEQQSSTLAELRDWFNNLPRLKKSGVIGAVALGAVMIGGQTHDSLTQTMRYGNVTCSGSDSFETSGSIAGDELLGQLADEMQISSDDKQSFSKIIADKNGMTFVTPNAIPEGTKINVPEHCS